VTTPSQSIAIPAIPETDGIVDFFVDKIGPMF